MKAHAVSVGLLALALKGASVCIGISPVHAAEAVSHPLHPLGPAEYSAVARILQKGGHIDHRSRFPLVVLQEPSKREVLGWRGERANNRKAFVIVKQGPETYEAIVDISQGRVESWQHVPDVQPGILLGEEWGQAQKVVKSDPAWQDAVRKRGIEFFDDVVCTPLTVGYFGIEEQAGRRLVKVVCHDAKGTKNYWGRPIEGLIAVLDVNEQKVIKLQDTGPVPIPRESVDLDEGSVGELRKPPHSISPSQPLGPSFKVSEQVVEWQKWQFHYRIDPRLGLVVSLVHYQDNANSRLILYQGSLSELYVPYMDPDLGWYFRTYLDAGEFGVGKLAAPIVPGVDCPANGVLTDVWFADDWGAPYLQPRAACLFERYAGDMLWRHYDAETQSTEVRKSTELVLRSISTVGNYDYVFDWVFRQDGSIKVAVGATGTEQVKAVPSRTIKEDAAGLQTAYGRMVAQHTVAPNHDHFFCFRLDLDVDGQSNSLLVDRIVPQRLEEHQPRKGLWSVNSEIIESEQAARLTIDLQKPAIWRVINPRVLGPVGYPVSYQLKPGVNAVSLLEDGDLAQERAGFTNHHLWVTPYDDQERYAAGTYPNQSGGDGLPRWTQADRTIRQTDLVLWYTVGFHHVVRAEDWPVLTTGWHGFELRPFDFFTRNPAIDLPRSR